MDLISRRSVLCSTGLIGVLRFLRAQDTTFSTDVKVVNVLATVHNKQGQIVQSLGKEDFVLEEDGRPQAIRYFSRETELPLTLGLLVDTSMSQRRMLGAERTASYRFLDQVLREDKDVAFVIHFDREVELLQDLTSSRKKLEASLGLLETPAPRQRSGPRLQGPPGPRGRRGGGTSLYDAVLLAADELMRKQKGRKAVILLTDGVDVGSKVTMADAIEAAQRADTLVYSVLFADTEAYPAYARYGGRRGGRYGGPTRMPPARPNGKKILQRLSQESGGGFFEVSKKHSIQDIFGRIEEELRSQYSLGYEPDQKAAGFHKIHLTAKSKDLIVQARDGYYSGGAANSN